ncbi:hypothetical protein SD71_13200 [Cohnella kolymensis]|uniref:TRAP transporter n=1 Tax=Cohnella kolymensis TaxID=1590652 RepID=A0ABR5A361_9BACL|nr:TAXI family TRAP transporter solute-binding subunit [Cohnella kolymensis]KIL35475.1 hypothetical protein SD71_13200 [Cohnella kolymensis]
MRKSFYFKSLCFMLISFLLLLGCSNQQSSSDSSHQKINLRFAAGSQSGDWYPLAVGITEMMKKNMNNLDQVSIEQGGGVANVMSVNKKQTEIGFSHGMSIIDGIKGNPPFKEKNENLTYVVSLDPYYMQIAVLKGSGINKIEDLKGKRINVGPKSATTEVAARMVLEAYGMSFEDMKSVEHLSHGDSVEQMKDKRLDALFWVMGAPFGAMTDLTETKDIEFLPIPEDKIQLLSDKNPAILKGTIKAGTYRGQDTDVTTLKTPLAVVANKDAPDDLVYEATKTIFNGLSELGKISPALKNVKPEDLPIDIGLSMHPGAKKFWEEQGLVK